jgi:hypothetical protein
VNAKAFRDETKAMTRKDKQVEEREALERLLDTYGADRTRWPARERLRFASVISEDKAAARLLAEAHALDRLLDRAPHASQGDIEALKERIVAAALRADPPRLAVVAGAGTRNILPLRRPSLPNRFTEWPAAAVLAASLVLGVMLGSAGTFSSTMQEMAQAAGFGDIGSDSSQLALGDYIDGQADEDLL